jgi:anti-sigma regulatory factor (Ser/Thr protein kinase)
MRPPMAGPGDDAHELLRIRLHGGRRFIEVAGGAAAGVACGLGFGPPDVERVRLAVDSLCLDVVEHHFDDPRQADFTLSVDELRGGLRVRLEDEGLPYPIDRFGADDGNLAGRRLSQGGIDSLRFESRGVAGNAVEMIVRRSPRHETHLEGQDDPGTAPVDADAPITVRRLVPDDAPGVARCVYRSYGYTYANDFVYYPDQLLSLIERDLLRSFVGVNAEGEVVGHSAILRDRRDTRVAESGLAVVDPRYRHHHLLVSIKGRLLDSLGDLDLVGTYADAVAVHAITQKANADIGARETGILLGEIPESTTFRGFETARQRGSVVVYYHPLRAAPAREVCIPRRYRKLLEPIYGALDLERTFREAVAPPSPGPGAVHVEVKLRRGLGRIEVEAAGADIAAEVARHLRALCLRRLDVIHLDLPLGSPMAMSAVDAFAGLGFFFGAVIPELRGGDVLRLQYLNNLDLDPDALVLYGDGTKRLLAGILTDRS